MARIQKQPPKKQPVSIVSVLKERLTGQPPDLPVACTPEEYWKWLVTCNLYLRPPSLKKALKGVETGPLVNTYLDHWENEVQPAYSTYRDRKQKLEAFARSCPYLPTTESAIRSYIVDAYPNPTQTRLQVWKYLGLFYQWCEERRNAYNGLPKNPLKGKKPPKGRAAPAARFSMSECKALIGALESPVDRAYVYLLLGQGWRAREEPKRLLVQDIEEDRILVRGKSRTEYQPLLPEVASALRPLCDGKKPTDPVFDYNVDYLTERFRKVCRKAHVPIRGPKVLRTTASSLWSASAGAGVALDAFMRHATPGVRGVYSRLTEEELVPLFLKYNPLRQVLYGLVASPTDDGVETCSTGSTSTIEALASHTADVECLALIRRLEQKLDLVLKALDVVVDVDVNPDVPTSPESLRVGRTASAGGAPSGDSGLPPTILSELQDLGLWEVRHAA